MKGDALSAALSTEGYGVSTTDRSTKNFAGNFGYMSFLTNGYMGMNYNNHASEPLPLPAEPLMATERRCSRPLKLSNSSYDPAVVYAKESSITSRPLHNMNADLLLPSPPSGVGDFQKLACGNLQATYGLQPAQTDAFPTPMPSTAPRQAQVKPSLLPTASIPSHLQYYPATNPHEIERLQKWIQEMDSGPSNSSVFAFSGQQSTLHAGNVLENGSLLSTNSCLPSNAPGAFDLSSFSSQAKTAATFAPNPTIPPLHASQPLSTSLQTETLSSYQSINQQSVNYLDERPDGPANFRPHSICGSSSTFTNSGLRPIIQINATFSAKLPSSFQLTTDKLLAKQKRVASQVRAASQLRSASQMRGPSQVRNLHLATPYSRRNGEKAEEVPARRRSTGGAIVMQGRVGDNVAAREVSLNGVPIYRRRSDGWINLSHICKAVGMQKGQRSRIINKETRECAHQKVQGGAAAFQGTWIPQYKAKQFVVAQGVYDSVRDLFDSTPPPQHTLHLV